MYINPSKPTGHCMYHQFNVPEFYVLSAQCICVLCGSENKPIISLQHLRTGFHNRDEVFIARYGFVQTTLAFRLTKAQCHSLYARHFPTDRLTGQPYNVTVFCVRLIAGAQ